MNTNKYTGFSFSSLLYMTIFVNIRNIPKDNKTFGRPEEYLFTIMQDRFRLKTNLRNEMTILHLVNTFDGEKLYIDVFRRL